MIATPTEYEKSQEAQRDLTQRLEKLQRSHPAGYKGLTKAGLLAPANKSKPLV